MKELVGAFNQEKALVGALSVIVKTGCGTDGALHSTIPDSVLISQTKWCCVVIGVNVQFPLKKFYHQLAGLSGWSLGHGSVFLQTINPPDWLLVQFKSTLKPTSYSSTATFMAFQKYLYDTK